MASAISDHPIKTTCPYCGVGCGVIASHEPAGITIKGDSQHPANYGRLCSKGSALAETLDLQGRLLTPQIDGIDCSWEQALDKVSSGLSSIIQQYGADAVAFYVSGQLLTEDYYVANKLMKGFIGSANIDTNSRLCMSSAVAAHKRAFGSDTVPCTYEDLENADLIVITGSNLAWCHPVTYQRILMARKKNPQLKIVVIDPRITATCDIADLHLAIKPGADAWLFNGLLAWLNQQQVFDQAFIDHHCEGVEDSVHAALAGFDTLSALAERCDLPVEAISLFFDWFTATEKTVTLFSQGINQSSSGTDKGNAIINCHLYTGRIGKIGMGPFSITGQPNAMGGREVGGLANQLAAHMEINNPLHQQLVKEFWQAPNLCQHEGFKAVELFDRIDKGEVKAVWIMATNPVDSLPQADKVRAALNQCDLVIVSDCMQQTDTMTLANVALPALAWGEKDGTVTNSERRISRQRAFLPPPDNVLADWQIICQVAARMGYAEAFAYQNVHQIFDEYARLTDYQNNGSRDLNLQALTGLSAEQYAQLEPVRWPCLKHQQADLFSDGHFYTASGKARMMAVTPRQPLSLCDSNYPLLLNTGRSRDQWHTMTRTGKAARLSGHSLEPVISLHPQTAIGFALNDQSLVEISNANGKLIARCHYDENQRANQAFMPIHWSEQFAANARVDVLTHAHTDPFSGQPEFKQTAIAIKPWTPLWQGFLLSKRRLTLAECKYWTRTKSKAGWLYHLAGNRAVESWSQLARNWLCDDHGSEWIEYQDQHGGYYRAARLNQGIVDSCVYLTFGDALMDSQDDPQWLQTLFTATPLDKADRMAILSGEPAKQTEDPGPTICACFSVGLHQISKAIHQHKLMTVEQITAQLQAGGNCGSCLPELKKILQAEQLKNLKT